MITESNFSLLVNTCDKFEDCWNPFFKLFTIYWPDYKGIIYLNTEYKDYSYPGLDIIPIKGCAKHNVPIDKPATWSQCLNWALEAIDTEIVLYMQEDYFLKNRVEANWVDYFYKLMLSNDEIPCIQLTSAGIPAIEKSNFNNLCISDPKFFSYVSCQASLWRKDIMMSLIREHETAWNFEWWGSKRARYNGYQFLTIDPQWLSDSDIVIMPYILTGVIGGKWYKPVVVLFKDHNIEIDFSKRGFYMEDIKPSFKKKIQIKLSVWKLKSFFEVCLMKLQNKK